MRTLLAVLIAPLALAGCLSFSSNHPAKEPSNTTVVVPPGNSGTTVICQDGSQPPCR